MNVLLWTKWSSHAYFYGKILGRVWFLAQANANNIVFDRIKQPATYMK